MVVCHNMTRGEGGSGSIGMKHNIQLVGCDGFMCQSLLEAVLS